MELLVSGSVTRTGVGIYQDGEYLRAATPCCGFFWTRNKFEFTCRCGIFTVEAFLCKEYIHLNKHQSAQAFRWVTHWTGLKEAVTEVTW